MNGPKYVKNANMWVVSWQEWKKDRWFTNQKWFDTKEEAKEFIQNNKNIEN